MQFKILSIYSLVVALVLSSCSGKKEEEKTVYENTTFRKNTENTVHLTEKQMQSVGVTTITIQDRNMENSYA